MAAGFESVALTGALVTTGGPALWVERDGAGDDLVLLCGLGDTHHAWAHQIETFAARFRVTAINNRGTGGSDLPPGPFTVADMAQDVAAVLDELGVSRAHVGGFSMGGTIAQELAIARPDLVCSLILVGTWSRTTRYQRALFDSWAELAQSASSEEAFVRALLLWVYTRRAHHDGSIERWVKEALEAEHPQTTDGYLRAIDAIKAHDSAERLGEVQAPSLVIGGDEDLICPAEVQRELVRRLDGSRLELLHGEAHQPFQEAPQRFNEIVLGFLERL